MYDRALSRTIQEVDKTFPVLLPDRSQAGREDHLAGEVPERRPPGRRCTRRPDSRRRDSCRPDSCRPGPAERKKNRGRQAVGSTTRRKTKLKQIVKQENPDPEKIQRLAIFRFALFGNLSYCVPGQDTQRVIRAP